MYTKMHIEDEFNKMIGKLNSIKIASYVVYKNK